ncbi:MAG: hypothetical protein A2X94_09170 [Bdellovibrionales bacterium GWB1_55_8]|nr:MAG: hypothetical protein A2X94_09170 [Bdellovibrionales bacterium GWB1_55_8]
MARTKNQNSTRVVSFRVSEQLHTQLLAFANTQVDEAGLPLNAHTAARRLMLRAMQETLPPNGRATGAEHDKRSRVRVKSEALDE